GLFVLEIRQKIVQIIEKEKDVTTFGLKLIFIIGFIIYFGFAMSSKYGKPAFPIDGNVFHGNSGFALFFLVIFTIFVIAWEKFLSRYIDHLFESISISTEQNESWITIRSIMHRFSWVGHLLVFLAIALYVGLTVNRARNYVSLIGIFTLILLGTIGM
ncbi:unnamed protein product, partial [Rotaria magnacalcarata]